MVKSYFPSSISEETVWRDLQKTDLKWTQFQRKRILIKNNLKLRLKLAQKFAVNVQYATMRCEIRKPILLERVEINVLNSIHLY